MNEKLIIECDYPTAKLLQGTLEDENISCRLVDQENVTSSMVNGGKLPMVQVYVYESDYGKTISLLKPCWMIKTQSCRGARNVEARILQEK